MCFSDEAIQWAKTHFPDDPKMEKWYDLCAELKMVDDKERIQAMNQKRSWKILYRNLVFVNHMGLGDYFFVFKFGYDLKVVKKYDKPKSAPREIDPEVTNQRATCHVTCTEKLQLDVLHSDALLASRPAKNWNANTLGSARAAKVRFK